MNDLPLIEQYYKKYTKSLNEFLPDGIYNLNIHLLHQLDLLHFSHIKREEPQVAHNFRILESNEKITLVNEEFVVWILPSQLNEVPLTYTLIAVNRENEPQLELAFIASGIYNTSTMVLKTLEKFLIQIQENEKMLKHLGQKENE